MVRDKPTPAMEDYLGEIYRLRERGEEITVQALAQALAVRPPSVTGMVKRLAAAGLLDHQRYQAIALTRAGEAAALHVLRHHRLLELYLSEFLDMPWEDVHAEADRLEHHISESLEERIAATLGDPTYDPHGDPIPSREGVIPSRAVRRLSELAPGESGCVAQITLQESAVLHYLSSLGVRPGVQVAVQAIAQVGGVVTLLVAAPEPATQTLGERLVRSILVTPSAPACLAAPGGRQTA